MGPFPSGRLGRRTSEAPRAPTAFRCGSSRAASGNARQNPHHGARLVPRALYGPRVDRSLWMRDHAWLIHPHMPTYEYRCPNGHDFDHFVQKISEGVATLPCPVCGLPAERRVSGGAGLVFRGSGFYITDYGKDGKKDQAVSPASGTTTGSKDAAKDGAKDSGKDAAKGDRSSDSRSGESRSGGEGAGASAKTEPSSTSPAESSQSKVGGKTPPAAGSKPGPKKSE